MEPKKILIFIGPPGSGKGTQAKRVAEKFSYEHVSTGDLLRGLAKKENPTAVEQQALETMQKGLLVGDLIYELTFAELRKCFAAGKGVVLDGATRTREQAELFQKFFEEQNQASEVRAIDITLPEAEAEKRLLARRSLESRPDDNPAVIAKRLAEQGNAALAPIRAFYSERGLLRSIDGNQPIEKVGAEIEKAIC